jgi:N utilization substance protein B
MVASSHNEGRSRGRDLALLTACHLESYAPQERAEAYPLLWDNPPGEQGSELMGLLGREPVRAFAADLVDLMVEHSTELDALIQQTSNKWRLDRMDRVDRNVLRLAAAELRHLPDTPRGVVLAEAVRLASRYGSERSAPFVNGLAEALAKELRPKEAATECG